MRDPKGIGKVVRELRGDLSLRDFAKKCDVSHTTIDNIEKGFDFRTGKPVQIKIDTIEKIAVACGVSISHIIGGPTIRNIARPAKNAIMLRGRDGSEEGAELTDEQLELFKNMLKQIGDKNK